MDDDYHHYNPADDDDDDDGSDDLGYKPPKMPITSEGLVWDLRG